MANNTQSREESVKKINELIKDMRIAMLTTVEDDKILRSRPMATQEAEFDGTIYFFTKEHSPKVDQINQEHHVNVAYSNPDKQHYVSVSGVARVRTDRAKMEELWTPELTAWFPQGIDDPDIALLEVEANQVEYWDSPNSTIVYLYGLAKAAVTGQPAGKEVGENEKVNL